jgi:uncharacterized membrane protein
MSVIQESIEVNVPVRVAYDQWTQFEDFPKFMSHVREIKQLDDSTTHWSVEVAGRTAEFDAKITEQIPDVRIAWNVVQGPGHAGAVDFHRLSDDKTQVMVVMDPKDTGIAGAVADALGIVRGSVREDLQRFKELIESRGEPTGAWRGEITQDDKG